MYCYLGYISPYISLKPPPPSTAHLDLPDAHHHHNHSPGGSFKHHHPRGSSPQPPFKRGGGKFSSFHGKQGSHEMDKKEGHVHFAKGPKAPLLRRHTEQNLGGKNGPIIWMSTASFANSNQSGTRRQKYKQRCLSLPVSLKPIRCVD